MIKAPLSLLRLDQPHRGTLLWIRPTGGALLEVGHHEPRSSKGAVFVSCHVSAAHPEAGLAPGPARGSAWGEHYVSQVSRVNDLAH